ncbi:Kelch-like protein 3 [Lamellibrachia satsuma]|nr:Kelch-like protein 3 [Lamellibrachia satsuma]
MLNEDPDVLARSLSTSPASAALECLPGLFHYEEDESAQKLYFSERSHALRVLEALNEQRRQHVLCDVIVCVDDQEFACHRSVLAACSPYFFAMFSSDMRESLEQRVSISGIAPAIMEQLINYAYTANITISQEDAQHLLSAANMVQMTSIREACCAFLEREMSPANCIGIYCFAEAHVCDILSAKAKAYAMENFSEVAQHDEILCLPCCTLVDLIASDELIVTSEEVVFQAVINWVRYGMG